MGRIPYWGCKSNLCGADLEGGGASNLTGADRGRMWIGAVSPASDSALPIYGIFSALPSITRTGALNVLYGSKSGGGESKGAVLKWGGESKGQF